MQEVFLKKKCAARTVVTSLALILSATLPGTRSGLLDGQQNGPSNEATTISFYSVAELTKRSGAQPSLDGARLANPKDWPASFYTVIAGSSCTATLVGPRALLTAAHCAPNNTAVTLMLARRTYRGTCTRSDLYSLGSDDGQSADWALCLMDNEVPVRQYETVNADPARIAMDAQLLLTGFGCTRANGTVNYDGNYRIGEAQVIQLPNGSNNDIITSGDAALCFGDSGGGAFIFLDPGKKRRMQVSVNSRVQTLQDGTMGRESHLSSLSTSQAQAFLKAWASRNGAGICGLTGDAKNCRN